MRGLRGKFALEPYRSLLLVTYPRPLAEDSPSDFLWGCRDLERGYTGQNLLGLALMQVRREPVEGLGGALERLGHRGIGRLENWGAPSRRNGTAARPAGDEQQQAAQADIERYRAALCRIAGAESGVWGWIAHDALTADSGAPAAVRGRA